MKCPRCNAEVDYPESGLCSQCGHLLNGGFIRSDVLIIILWISFVALILVATGVIK